MAPPYAPRVALSRDRGATALLVTVLLGFGTLAALVRADRGRRFDVGVTVRLQRWRWPWLRRFMTLVSWPGFSPQSRLIPLVLAAVHWRLGRPIEARYTLLAWGVSALSAAIKAIMRRPRPTHPEVRVVTARLDSYSFPSGHVLAYVSIYGFQAYCAYTLPRPTAARRALAGALSALIACVGPSRVYQGHHWPTDVLASYCLGLGYLLGVLRLYRRALARDQQTT